MKRGQKILLNLYDKLVPCIFLSWHSGDTLEFKHVDDSAVYLTHYKSIVKML